MTTSPAGRLRDAAAATFAVHVCQSLLALAPAWPLARAVERTLATHPLGLTAWDTPGGLWRMETLAALRESWGLLGDVTLIALLLSLALAPILQMMWLAALLRRRRLHEALALGVRRYAAAVGISIALVPALALALGTLVSGPLVLSRVVQDVPSDRTHDLIVLAGAVPGLLLLAVWALWHDLSRASLARGADIRSAILRGALGCVRPSGLPAYLLWLSVGIAVAVSAPLVASALDDTPLASLAITQALGLARTFVRGRWLADAIDRTR